MNDFIRAAAYLKRDPIHHMDMLQTIHRGTAEVLVADSCGVLLQERVSQAYLLTAETPQDAARLMDYIIEPCLMAVHQYYAADEAKYRFGLEATMCCHQAVWLNATPPSVPPSPFRIELLSQDKANDVLVLYSHDIGLKYIKGRLLAGEMFGAFIGDELAGFIGLHEEGSMGMLEVVHSFRRKGVGSLLIAYLCGRLLEKGLTPFSQFTIDNESSRRLHERLGFSISTDRIYWLELAK